MITKKVENLKDEFHLENSLFSLKNKNMSFSFKVINLSIVRIDTENHIYISDRGSLSLNRKDYEKTTLILSGETVQSIKEFSSLNRKDMFSIIISEEDTIFKSFKNCHIFDSIIFEDCFEIKALLHKDNIC